MRPSKSCWVGQKDGSHQRRTAVLHRGATVDHHGRKNKKKFWDKTDP